MSPTDKISGKIISQFTKQMRKQGLYTAGCGGGESGGKINLVDVVDVHPPPLSAGKKNHAVSFAIT